MENQLSSPNTSNSNKDPLQRIDEIVFSANLFLVKSLLTRLNLENALSADAELAGIGRIFVASRLKVGNA